jgi:hypothetical protein
MTSSASMPNLAVYTTYCGSSKNKTLSDRKVSQIYPHYFISNNWKILEEAKKLGWKPIPLMGQEVSEDPIISAMQAKIAKANPQWFPELEKYDHLFYIDDKLQLDEKKVKGLTEKLDQQNSPLAIRRHAFLGPNILYEFAEAMKQPRYQNESIRIANYITEKVGEGFGLESDYIFWTSALLRNMRHPDTIAINKMWHREIQKCGIECQISFYYVSKNFSNITLLPHQLD